MNEKHWEYCIKKAVTMEIESHTLPDPEKTWQKIEGTIELFERLQQSPKKNWHRER